MPLLQKENIAEFYTRIFCTNEVKQTARSRAHVLNYAERGSMWFIGQQIISRLLAFWRIPPPENEGGLPLASPRHRPLRLTARKFENP